MVFEQPNRRIYTEADAAVYTRYFNTMRYEENMLTFIKMAIRLEKPASRFSDDFMAVALFSGIGLVLTLVAVSCGVQGVWF
jgi:hypothetical protein